MSVYIIGIILAIVAAGLHSCANILDSYFSVKVFDRLGNLIFFSALVNLLFLPLVFLSGTPRLLPADLFGIVFLIAMINVFYQYPYYWSLRKTDTSIVTSLFSLGKIFTPLFAFLVVGEQLKNTQYTGFFIIICSCVMLTWNFKKFRLNPAFIYMLIVSVILTIQVILYKFLFDRGISWATSVTWAAIADFFISSVFIFFPRNLQDFKKSAGKVKKLGWLFILNQLFTWGGEVLGLYAIFYIPVSVFEGISDFQPIFVLVFAALFAAKKPEIFKEYVNSEGIRKKIFFFLIMIFGAILII